MLIHHKGLKPERWYRFSLMEQLANIGSDALCAIRWKNKGSQDSKLAFERSFELFYLTVSDPKNRKQLKEICRAREAWIVFLHSTTNIKQQMIFGKIILI